MTNRNLNQRRLRALCGCAIVVLAGLTASESQTIELLNGKNLDGWKFLQPAERSHWTLGKAELNPSDPATLKVSGEGNELINPQPHGIDIYTTNEFGDCRLELELMVAKGSNSGVFMMRNYEVQILDSYGKKEMGTGDMGAIYGAAAPLTNACKPAGEWQKLVVEFRAPRFNGEGLKVTNAMFVSITLNGTLLQKNVEVKNPTTGTSRKERPKDPLSLQGNHGPVAFRNIRISSLN